MSVASVVGQVVFSQKSGVYMPMIQSAQGDLYQEYLGTADSPTNVAPDFTSLQPLLSFIVTSSRVAEGLVTPQAIRWYFNDTELTFSSNVSTNTFGGETGHFQFVDYTVNGYYGLKIVKNLVKASGAAACVIRAEADVTVGNSSDTVQFVYSIPITKGVGMQQRVTIVAGDSYIFTITEKNSSCILKAVTRLGNDEITTGLTYKWYRQSDGAWVEQNVTTQTLTVTNDMVDTSGVFMVKVYKDGSLIGQDIQTVVDASDPYDIIVGAVKTNETSGSSVQNDETISDVKDVITYTPRVVKRGTDTTPDSMSGMTFYFVFMNSVGIVMNADDYTTALSSKSVDYEMCSDAGGNLTYTITTAQ